MRAPSSSTSTSPRRPYLPLKTRNSPATSKMGQPIVQTIHRDPALLYVDEVVLKMEKSRAELIIAQLVDSTPHHSGHGRLPCPSFPPRAMYLKHPPGPDRHPPPLRNDTPPNPSQKGRPPQNPTTAIPRQGRQSTHQRQCALPFLLCRPEILHGASLPRGQVFGRA